MNLLEMWNAMGWFAKGIAYVLFFMSMLSFGVACLLYTSPSPRD